MFWTDVVSDLQCECNDAIVIVLFLKLADTTVWNMSEKGLTVCVDAERDEGGSHEKSNIRLNNEPIFFWFEKCCCRGEMVRVLSSVLLRSGHVHNEVSRHPSCVEVVLSVSHLNFNLDFSKTDCTVTFPLQVNSPSYLQ